MLIKRIFDIVATLIISVVIIPILISNIVFIYIFIGRPTVFTQTRPGLHGKAFKLYKFRTMTKNKDTKGQLLPDKNRITKFGSFLRKTSLDELPSFWNVLKGDMSLVGPRPLLMEYLDCYSPEQARRHEVKPGITGWAQVNGRNAISWEEKFKLDVWYVDNQSFWLDVRILLLTFCKVLNMEDISYESEATMKPFEGNFQDRGASK